MSFPDPPSVGWVTRYLLESAWVLGGVLVGMALVVGFMFLRDGRYDRLKAVAVVAAVGVAIFITGAMVTTSGEHAAALTRDLVSAAVAGDVPAAMDCFAPDASLSIGAATNEGVPIDAIRRSIDMLRRRYKVVSNRVTQLDAYTLSGREARVDLACVTDAGWGPTPSTWMLRVQQQPDGSWKVRQITCLTINRQLPPRDAFR